MLTYIGKYRELSPKHPEYPSIKDYFAEKPYDGQGRIVFYLRKGGNEDMVSMAIKKDVITGKPLLQADVGRNDGLFTWWSSLAHYVENYNLRLPEEFEKHILNDCHTPEISPSFNQ